MVVFKLFLVGGQQTLDCPACRGGFQTNEVLISSSQSWTSSNSGCPAGKNPSDEYLEGMMSEAPGPINFTMFLTMFGERLNGTDPEDVIRNAFACFDEEGSGEWI